MAPFPQLVIFLIMLAELRRGDHKHG